MPTIPNSRPDATSAPSPYLEQRSGSSLEYVYQAAILVAVLLLLWTATA